MESSNEFEIFEANLNKNIEYYKPKKYDNRLIEEKERRQFDKDKLGKKPQGLRFQKMGTVLYTIKDKDVKDKRR